MQIEPIFNEDEFDENADDMSVHMETNVIDIGDRKLGKNIQNAGIEVKQTTVTAEFVGADRDEKSDYSVWCENMRQIFSFNILGTSLYGVGKDLSGKGQYSTEYGWCATNGPIIMCYDVRLSNVKETEVTPEMAEMLELLHNARYINLARKDSAYAKHYYKQARKQWIEQTGEKRIANTPEMRIVLQESNLFNFTVYRMPSGYSFSSVYLNDALTAVEGNAVLSLGLVSVYGKEIPMLRIRGERGTAWLFPRHKDACVISDSVQKAYKEQHAELVEQETVESSANAENIVNVETAESVEPMSGILPGTRIDD